MKLIIFLGCSIFSAALSAASFDDLYKQGITEIREGRTEEALNLFKQAAEAAENKVQKTNAVLQISLSMPQAQEKDALQMLMDYRKSAVNLPPQSEACLELRIGVLQARQKQYAEASESLSYALSINQLSERDSLLAFDMLSNSFIHQKKYQESLNCLEKWEKLEGLSPDDYSRIFTRRAGILGAQKRFDDAYKNGSEAASIPGISPINQALAWQMLAHIALNEEKDPQKAKSYSEKSMSVKDGKWGFNQDLHAKILKACSNEK